MTKFHLVIYSINANVAKVKSVDWFLYQDSFDSNSNLQEFSGKMSILATRKPTFSF